MCETFNNLFILSKDILNKNKELYIIGQDRRDQVYLSITWQIRQVLICWYNQSDNDCGNKYYPMDHNDDYQEKQ